MKKAIILIVTAILLLSTLTSCACEHDWQDATCTEPLKCHLCDETAGNPLGHRWVEATCTVPKTCENCGETEGEFSGHIWQNATCYSAKYCTVCDTVEGEALGHDYQDKYCTRCYNEDPNAFFPEKYGFTNTYGMDYLITIVGYNLNEGYVLVMPDTYQKRLKISPPILYIERYRPAEGFSNDFTARTTKSFDNDTIVYKDDWDYDMIDIFDRIVYNDLLVLKCNVGNDENTYEEWYVLQDQLDMDSYEEVDGKYRFFFKN